MMFAFLEMLENAIFPSYDLNSDRASKWSK